MAKKLTNEEIGTLRRAAEIVEKVATQLHNEKRLFDGVEHDVIASGLREIAKRGQRRETA